MRRWIAPFLALVVVACGGGGEGSNRRTIIDSRDNLMISLALLPLAIAANVLGFWLVLRIWTELFYRISYALIFLISAAIFAQGVTGLLRG